MRKKLILAVAFVLIAAALLGTSVIMAQSGGQKKGVSQTGCGSGSCHQGSFGSTVDITGPSPVIPGSVNDITVTVGNWVGTYGGLNAETPDGGTFAAGANTQEKQGQITHTDELSRAWTFTWTAPDSTTALATYRLNVVGLAADESGDTSGDSWALGWLDIVVQPTCESYKTNSYAIVWGTPADHYDGAYSTAWMEGDGFKASNEYKIGYYDDLGDNVAVEAQTSTAGGVLTGGYDLTTNQTAAAGLWHAVVIDTTGNIPATYTDALLDANYVVDDDFEVDSDAIPEFPSALASISVLGLCTAVYLYLRRRDTIQHLLARQTPL